MTAQPSQAQIAQQQAKSHHQTRERDRDRGEKRPQHSAPDELPERGRTSRLPQPSDTNGTGGEDEPITMGVPHLLLEGRDGADGGYESQSESEPEPTLVARPGPSGKSGRSGAQVGKGKGNGGIIDRPRSRAPSEPLFFPESDEEGNDAAGRIDKGKKKEGPGSGPNGDKGPCPLQVVRSATIATGSAASTSTLPRSSTSIPDKPRSVQTVLSTRGAAWNIRKDGDRGAEDGRERKRARLSSEGDRVLAKKQSFRSSLSQFLSTGKKALPDEEEESEGDRDRDRGIRKGGDSSDEVDELDSEDEGKKPLGKGRKKPPRAGSDSSQVTVTVLSDGEHAMDVDEPPPTVTKPSHPPSIPPTSTGDGAGDVEIVSEDDWAFSSTLVGTYVPPAGKTVKPSSNVKSTRPLPETDTDFVTLRVNLVNIGSYYLDMYNHLSSSPPTPPVPTPSSTLRSAVSSANLDTAAEDTVASAALSRIISKADFEHMVVVGQFNLGFIIVRKRRDVTMDDLFIVDQHAADEKWNFETLQEKTVIASQKLFRCVFLLARCVFFLSLVVHRPQQLQFTAADEMLAVENMDVLKLNGFELEQVSEREAPGDEGEEGSGVRMRLHLVAQPMSKDTVFDIKGTVHPSLNTSEF